MKQNWHLDSGKDTQVAKRDIQDANHGELTASEGPVREWGVRGIGAPAHLKLTGGRGSGQTISARPALLPKGKDLDSGREATPAE